MSGCADVCLSMEWAEDAPSFYSEVERKAAKSHKCCECRAGISVGARYQCATGKWDGAVTTFRTCLACAEIRTTFCCGAWVFGALWETVDDEMFPDWNTNLRDVECLARLKSDAATAKMRERYATFTENNA